jgi:hypothetical protein
VFLSWINLNDKHDKVIALGRVESMVKENNRLPLDRIIQLVDGPEVPQHPLAPTCVCAQV